jgi:hypothetical protein
LTDLARAARKHAVDVFPKTPHAERIVR